MGGGGDWVNRDHKVMVVNPKSSFHVWPVGDDDKKSTPCERGAGMKAVMMPKRCGTAVQLSV
jgi:hypothetical protein